MGSFFAIAVNSSLTFSAVFALVSKNSRFASRAYASASAVCTARLSGCSATRSALLPARAMMMFSLAWRWSSFTQDLALSRLAYSHISIPLLPFLVYIACGMVWELTACVMS